MMDRSPRTFKTIAEMRQRRAPGWAPAPLPPVDPERRPALAPGCGRSGVEEAWAAWEGHVDAGRIGAPAPARAAAGPDREFGLASLERILGIAGRARRA